LVHVHLGDLASGVWRCDVQVAVLRQRIGAGLKLGVCLAFPRFVLGSRAVYSLLARPQATLASLPPPSPRSSSSFETMAGSASRLAEDAVAALVSSSSLTAISPSSSLSSRASYQRSASESPSRGSVSSMTSSRSLSSSKRELTRTDVDGGMLNPVGANMHHRHGTNYVYVSSEPGELIPRDRSTSPSPSPSRRGRRAYPSSPSDTPSRQSRSPSASRYRPRNVELKPGHDIDSAGTADDTQSTLSTYDTLIAFAFVLCVVLFFRALAGGGSSDPEHALSKTGETWWQRHHAFASSREHLHAKAGVHTCGTCHDGETKSEVGEAPGVWHKGGVHVDAHAHLSVDPEGHFSYGFHHNHGHDHEHEQNDNDQYDTANAGPSRSSAMTLTWAIPRFFRRSESTEGSEAIETPSSGAEDHDGLQVDNEGAGSIRVPDKETVDDDPFVSSDPDAVEVHDYAVRVHLPSAEEGAESGVGRTLHRKERARTMARGKLHA